jgi:hypothetical protein
MVRRGEHEAEADLIDASPDGGGRQVDPRAERFEQIRRAR